MNKIHLVLYVVLSLAVCDLYRRHNKQDRNLYEADQNMVAAVNGAIDEIDGSIAIVHRKTLRLEEANGLSNGHTWDRCPLCRKVWPAGEPAE